MNYDSLKQPSPLRDVPSTASNNTNPFNHKGALCSYKKLLLCQEGYCEECQIYLDWLKSLWD